MKIERFNERECQRSEEHREKDVEHAFLRILGANLHDLLAVGHRGFLHPFELDVGLDEFDRAIGARGHGLCRCAGEPVNHRAAGDQAEHKGRMQQREFVHIAGQSVGQRHDDGKNHGGRPDHGSTDQHRLGSSLESIARAVVGFEQVLGAFEIHVDVEIALQFGLDIRYILDQGQFIH